jgi:Flp pilus assembly protein TadG
MTPHLRQRMDERWGDESGSITIEFAIMIPVVLMLIVGSMVVMLGLLAFANATYATALAARFASVHGYTSDTPATSQAIAAQVQAHLWIGGPSAQTTTSWTAGNIPGSSVTVATALTVPLGIPFTGLSQLTLSASSVRTVMR